MQPLLVAVDHLLEEGLDVGEQGRLELVDEQRAGRVHRPEADGPARNLEPARVLHNPVRQVHQLHALIGLNQQHSPWMVNAPDDAVATGVGRELDRGAVGARGGDHDRVRTGAVAELEDSGGGLTGVERSAGRGTELDRQRDPVGSGVDGDDSTPAAVAS